MEEKQIHGFTIRPQILELIQRDVPGFTREHSISETLLKHYKLEYVDRMLGDSSLARAIRDHDVISDDYVRSLEEEPKDNSFVAIVAAFASSHKFGITLIVVIVGWIIFNHWKPFDGYPYNLLDLILGVTATLQALFIMISQEKSAKKDRQKMLNTLKISLKNEFELNILREKIDHIITIQNPYILEEIRRK